LGKLIEELEINTLRVYSLMPSHWLNVPRSQNMHKLNELVAFTTKRGPNNRKEGIFGNKKKHLTHMLQAQGFSRLFFQ